MLRTPLFFSRCKSGNINSLSTQRTNFKFKFQNTSLKFSVFSNKHNNTSRFYCTTKVKEFSEFTRGVLTEQQNSVIKEEKDLLTNLQLTLVKLGSKEDDIKIIRHGLRKLDELFSLVIIGEFNSGKSTFINALLGDVYLDEGITPTTSKINVLKYSPSITRTLDPENSDIEYIKLPIEWLKDINIVDTPGTNAIIRSHEEITQHFVPQSDLILFITSVDRALSESERLFLQKIEQWNKKIIIILSKIDILLNPSAEIKEVTDYIMNNLSKEFRYEGLPIFPVSSKETLQSKSTNKSIINSDFSKISKLNQFSKLEEYILTTLDLSARTKLKLENPLGVARNLLAKNRVELENQSLLLRDDQTTLKEIQNDIDYFVKDMKRDFKQKLLTIDNSLLRLQKRCDEYIDENLRLSNVLMLVQDAKIRLDFEKKVVGNTSSDIDTLISDLIDWMVDRNTKEWNRIVSLLQNRSNSSPLNSSFDYTRKQLLSSIGTCVNSLIQQIDRDNEAARLTESVKSSMLQTVAVTGAGVGIGAILSLAVLDFTGILGVSIVAATGLAILPYKRAKIKRDFSAKIESLRGLLTTSITTLFDKEIENGKSKILGVVQPFSQYIEQENARIVEVQREFSDAQENIVSLEEKIQTLWPNK